MEAEKGSLELTYKGDMEEHLREWFDSRITVMEYHLKQYKDKIKRCEQSIKELEREKNSWDMDKRSDCELNNEIRNKRGSISEHQYIIDELIMDQLGWLYEIKHRIMKID